LRVEHFGKGAPPFTTGFIKSRPVPAVTGAFMSVERNWFETIGGFSEDYVFGHYEDADFCLKSLRRGIPPWVHDIKLWHLEGKGSHRHLVHDGASIVNRWLFNKRWAQEVVPNLLGQAPNFSLFKTHHDQEPMPVDRVNRPDLSFADGTRRKATTRAESAGKTIARSGGERTRPGSRGIEVVFDAK
jgi:hypothetical protein